MLKTIGFKSLGVIDYKNQKRWAKSGDSYRLIKADRTKDVCHVTFTNVETKAFKPDEKLYISGIANANIIDRMEERLDPRGLDVTDYLKNPVLLLDHDYCRPVGNVTVLDIQDDGVHFEGWVGDPQAGAPLTADQILARSLIVQKVYRAVSVGFIPKQIRPPSFANDGTLTEPLVVEQWELLELSIVAVPCNQDSTFIQLSAASKSLQVIAEQSKTMLRDVEADGLGVQAIDFEKLHFSKNQAVKWLQENGFNADNGNDLADVYRYIQKDITDFEDGTFKTFILVEGVSAVAGKTKEAPVGDQPNQNPGDAPAGGGEMKDVLAAVQGVKEEMVKMAGQIDLCVKLLQEDQSTDANEGDGGDAAPVAPAGEPAKMMARIEALEKMVDKLVHLLSLNAK